MSEPAIFDLAVIGGGAGSFIGPVHRIAARLDGHYEHGLNVWDWAAGALIAAEAGAVLLLPDPDEPGTEGSLVVVAAPGVATQLIDALERFDGLRPLP
jgi:myo-inositol-1(or 4)-monophosphatase